MNTFDDIQTVSQPSNIRIGLFNHQLASIYQMERMEEDKEVIEYNKVVETSIGVNADPTGYGKCHGVDTPILMYDGSIKKVQHVKTGDTLMGDDSTPRTVLSLARGTEKLYKIEQEYGDSYVVNQSHILSLKLATPKFIVKNPNAFYVTFFSNNEFFSRSFPYKKENELSVKLDVNAFFNSLHITDTVDIPLMKYLELPTHVRERMMGYKSVVNFPTQKLTTDPYKYGVKIGKYLKTKFCFKLKSIHIPTNYMINSVSNRVLLVSGIIDSLCY